jgi:hypothetical protein
MNMFLMRSCASSSVITGVCSVILSLRFGLFS